MANKTIYPNLKKTIKMHKDTYIKLGAMLNIAPKTIWEKMSGKREWKISEIKAICERYDKKFEDLF